MPWILALWMTNDLVNVLHEAPGRSLFWAYTFGVLWGLGGLTFGLTMRYLGLSLGMAVALGFTTAFGTMVPPIFAGEFTQKLLQPIGGRIVLAGILVTLIGIALVALAGRRKETELSPEEQKLSIGEFNYRKGLAVAT